MNLFTIGFTKKTAEQFFELIKLHQISILLDIRLNNKSQLAGYSKGEDLRYFLSEICNCKYRHCLEYAPTKEILDDYKKKQISWDIYVDRYTELMRSRADYLDFFELYSPYENVCLLCSEPTANHCHRRLLSEMIEGSNRQGIKLKHI